MSTKPKDTLNAFTPGLSHSPTPNWNCTCLYRVHDKEKTHHSNYFRVSLLCQTASAYCDVIHQFIKSGALVFFHFKV